MWHRHARCAQLLARAIETSRCELTKASCSVSFLYVCMPALRYVHRDVDHKKLAEKKAKKEKKKKQELGDGALAQ